MYNISTYLQSWKSINEISPLVRVQRSTMYRKIHYNSNQRNSVYKEELAQKKYNGIILSCNHCVMFTDYLNVLVDILLKKDYDLEQVIGIMCSRDLEIVSHGTIYQYV